MSSRAGNFGGARRAKAIEGAWLRRLRKARGLSAAQAGQQIGATQSKISRIETGAVGAKRKDVTRLLDLYNVTYPYQRGYLLSLLDQAHPPGWWHKHQPPLWLETYLAAEAQATLIRIYHNFVPALLQTEDHVRMSLKAADMPPSLIDVRADIILSRQALARRPDGPHLWLVLDEAALLRRPSDPHVQLSQLDALADAAKEPNLTLQIIPMTTGGYMPHTGSFTILRRADRNPSDVVYLPGLAEDYPLGADREVDAYLHTHTRLCITALTPSDTFDLLDQIREYAKRDYATSQTHCEP